MINLKVNNALGRCTTFDAELDVNNVYNIVVSDENTRAFVRENLDALKKTQADYALERALKKILKGSSFSHKLKRRLKAIVKSSITKRFT
jgi:predicted metal-dependent hydrolase